MMTYEHGKIPTLVESIAESTTACLAMMVQGDVLSITLGHLAIASETGIIAGVVASIVVIFSRTRLRWMVALTLGAVTTVVDFFVHPGPFGPIFIEALATGLGAAILSFLMGIVIHRVRAPG